MQINDILSSMQGAPPSVFTKDDGAHIANTSVLRVISDEFYERMSATGALEQTQRLVNIYKTSKSEIEVELNAFMDALGIATASPQRILATERLGPALEAVSTILLQMPEWLAKYPRDAVVAIE
jgi:hypothetical protein